MPRWVFGARVLWLGLIVGGCASQPLLKVDMSTVLKLGAARGYDLAGLSELLPAAEAGLVEAMRAGEG